jgi:hypothetical protein
VAKLHPDQLNLAQEDTEQTIAKPAAIGDAMRKRRINRGALPAHLPRIHEGIASAECIGEETSERST